MHPKTYQVERNGQFNTVRAQSAVMAATGLFPELKPPSWETLPHPTTAYKEHVVVGGVATVVEL